MQLDARRWRTLGVIQLLLALVLLAMGVAAYTHRPTFPDTALRKLQEDAQQVTEPERQAYLRYEYDYQENNWLRVLPAFLVGTILLATGTASLSEARRRGRIESGAELPRLRW